MEEIANKFFFDGKHADDFYYTFTSNGRKTYYSRVTGTRTSTDRIPKKLLPQIKELSKNVTKAKLLKQRESFLKQIADLRKKVDEIDKKLAMNPEEMEKESKNAMEDDAKEAKKAEECKKRDKEERKRLLEQLFRQAAESQREKEERERRDEEAEKKRAESQKKRQEEKKKAEKEEQDLLSELGINTKKEWKDWLVKNHPDKGGSTDMCSRVVVAGRKKGW